MNYPQLKQYHFIRKICSKFCFTVYEGKDLRTKNRIFIKVLNQDMTQVPSAATHFLTGARIGKILKNKSGPQILQYGIENDQIYAISEYIAAKPLSLFIHEEFPLNPFKVIDITLKIAKAARLAHLQGVAHGLLNPGTIYISEEGLIFIDDFHFGWLVPNLTALGASESRYLSYYLPPEIFFSTRPVDGRTDIYAIGAILMQLLADDFIFNDKRKLELKYHNLSAKIPSVIKHFPQPDKLSKILEKALDIDIEKRYQNLKYLICDLKDLASSLSPDSGRPNKNVPALSKA